MRNWPRPADLAWEAGKIGQETPPKLDFGKF